MLSDNWRVLWLGRKNHQVIETNGGVTMRGPTVVLNTDAYNVEVVPPKRKFHKLGGMSTLSEIVMVKGMELIVSLKPGERPSRNKVASLRIWKE